MITISLFLFAFTLYPSSSTPPLLYSCLVFAHTHLLLICRFIYSSQYVTFLKTLVPIRQKVTRNSVTPTESSFGAGIRGNSVTSEALWHNKKTLSMRETRESWRARVMGIRLLSFSSFSPMSYSIPDDATQYEDAWSSTALLKSEL